jgi:uncharacterized membrane protein
MQTNRAQCPYGTVYDPAEHAACPCLNCWADRSSSRLAAPGDHAPKPEFGVDSSSFLDRINAGAGERMQVTVPRRTLADPTSGGVKSSPTSPRISALLLALLAVISALLSSYASTDAWGLLTLFDQPKDMPLLPAIYFGLVLCTGIYIWESRSLSATGILLLAILISWICAWQVTVQLHLYLTSAIATNPPVIAEGSNQNEFLKEFALMISGFAGGLIGSWGTAVGVSLVSPNVRNRSFFVRTVLVGFVTGGVLQTTQLLFLFTVWQPAVAASIAYGICRPKSREIGRRSVQVLRRHQAGGLAMVWIVTVGIGMYFKHHADQVTEENSIYDAGSGGYLNTDRDVSKLQTYLDTCKICAKKDEALTGIRDEKTFLDARRSIAGLEAYLDACNNCAHAFEAGQLLASLKVKQHLELITQAESTQYRFAKDDTTRLQAYVNGCEVCEFKDQALAEIARLQFFSFKICNATSFRAAAAIEGRTGADDADWAVHGWVPVDPNSCTDAGNYRKGWLYVMAVVVGNASLGWRGAKDANCVNLNSNFSHHIGSCSLGEKTEGFQGLTVTSDAYTWTIQGTPTEDPNEYFTFEVCNNSCAPASVAVSSYSTSLSAWTVSGWTTAAANQCTTIGKFKKGDFYYYAKSYYGNFEWSGSFPLCVKIPGRFEIVNRPGYQCRSPNQVKLFGVNTIQADSYTWPIGGLCE